MTTATLPNFVADEERRIFTLDGRRLESVTEVLADNGWIDTAWYRPIHSLRGQRVHYYCQYIDEGEDLAATLRIAAADKGFDFGQGIEPYWPENPELGLDGSVESYRKCRDRYGFQMLDIERRLWHPNLLYTGRPDRRARRGKDEWVLDLKPESHRKAYEYQTGAYTPLFGPYNGVRRRAGIHYQRDGAEAILREHADIYDTAHFNCMLDCTRQRRLHRIGPIKGE